MDEEAVKPCIQDRLRLIAMRSKEIFASWPIICLTIIILIIIILPEILTLTIGREVIIPIFSEISLEIRLTILISFSALSFSSLQYISARNRNKIDDARNKLEKAYGPLYSILNSEKYKRVGKTIIGIMEIDEDDNNKINEILAKYPFMFPPRIFEYWRDKIQLAPKQSSNIAFRGYFYNISTEFRDMINEEYENIKVRYNKLLGEYF